MGRTRRRSTVISMVIGISASIAACSSSSNDAIDLGTSPDSAVTTSTAVAVSSTSQPTTTSPPTSDASTTIPATTEDQVEADFLAAADARRQCGIDPAHCDYEAIAVPGSPWDNFTRSTMRDRIEANLRAVLGKGASLLRVEDVSIKSRVAYVTTCAFDTVVLFDVVDPNNPDDDIVFNDSSESARVKWELHQIADRWLIFSDVRLTVLTGGDLCAF